VLTGMWRRDQVAAQEDCREHNIQHCFPSAEALCASDEVDVVFITSPDAMHRDDTLLALRHGKAVLCEKPLSMHANEAEEMVAAAEEAKLLFGVGQNFRYNHTLDWMREQIAAGKIGEPQLARAEFAYPANTAPRKWINDLNLACGGPIGDVGVHCIDSLRYVLDQDVVSVATLAREIAPGSRVDAYASLQLAMTGGVFAAATVSGRAPYRSLVEVSGSDGVLIAENGLTVDRPVEVALRRMGEVIESKMLDNGDGYVRMLDDFARAYRGEGEFRATGRSGLHNMRALDAAYTSWRTGQREQV
jgi:1,5-anhydro-D-fructose reductase (1,5-anhydro-D-mannitol-forming)